MTNYYKILGVENFASKEEIRTAYRKLSKKFHPDVNDGDTFFTEKFKEIQEAYEHLTDDTRKKRHDDQLHNQFQKPNESYEQKSNNMHDSSNEYSNKTGPYKKKNRSGLIFILAILLAIFFSVRYFNRTEKENSIVHDLEVSHPVEVTPIADNNIDTSSNTTNSDEITNNNINEPESNNKNTQLESNYSSDYFSIGSTKDEVLQIQGNPSSVSKIGGTEYWRFGSSSVDFENGRVSQFSNHSNNLKVKLIAEGNNSNGLNYFSIGSTKDEVLQIQGNPTSVSKIGSTEYWRFGSSSVDFENGRVSQFSNHNNNLKVKL